MATVTKRDSKWRCQVRRHGFPLQAKTFDCKGDAVRWGREIESKMDGMVFVSADTAHKTKFGTLLSRYMLEIAPTKRSECSMKGLAKTLDKHFGRCTLTTITPACLAAYRNTRLLERSPQTVIHELNMLNRVLMLATSEWGVVLPAGIPKIIKPRKPPGRNRRVTPDELNALMAAAKDSPELPTIIQLALETGMRRTELMSLQHEHINLDRRTAHIPITKTDTPRTVPLASRAVVLLQPKVAQGTYGPVFAVAPDSVTQAFGRAVLRARAIYLKDCAARQATPDPRFLVNLRFHDLRHEATSRFFEKGLGIMEVAAITGHKTLSMLQRYTHLRAEDLALKLG